jgi:hypothetical protein
MVPGINTDVTHHGIDYHVQTEDLGQEPEHLTLHRNGALSYARRSITHPATEPSPSLIRALGRAAPKGHPSRSDGGLEARAWSEEPLPPRRRRPWTSHRGIPLQPSAERGLAAHREP